MLRGPVCSQDLGCVLENFSPPLSHTNKAIQVLAFLIIQSCAAIVTAIVLFVLVRVPWPVANSHWQKKHNQGRMMATVDFQIAQGCFAGAVQITALVFTAQQILFIRWVAFPKLLDAALLFTLATNGFVPTVLTLDIIMQREGSHGTLSSRAPSFSSCRLGCEPPHPTHGMQQPSIQRTESLQHAGLLSHPI